MEEDFYQTTDILIATCLTFFGFQIEKLERMGETRSVFFFTRNEDLEACVESFHRKELQIEPQEFYFNMKTIKSRIHSV